MSLLDCKKHGHSHYAVACPKCLREGQESKTNALLARATAAESALAEARAALATAAAVLERAASMWPMVPGYEDRAREFGAAAEAAAKAAGGATPMRDALGALGTQIAFLRSCIRSGESLSPADNEQIDAALARAGGEVPAAGVPAAEAVEQRPVVSRRMPMPEVWGCVPFPEQPATGPIAPAAPGAGEQRQEGVGLCQHCGEMHGIFCQAPAPTPKDPEEGRACPKCGCLKEGHYPGGCSGVGGNCGCTEQFPPRAQRPRKEPKR